MFWLLIALIALIIGSYTDFKTKEVPDWFNYGLIFVGIGLSAIYSAVVSSWTPLFNSAVGLVVGMGVAFAMFYLGQWGGGDSKMIMALGAILGFDFSYNSFFLSFLINVFFLGALYGVVYGIVLAIKHKKDFVKEFSRFYHEKKNKVLRRFLLALGIALFVLIFFTPFILKIYFAFLIIIIFAAYYLYVFAKTIEKCCMLKKVSPEVLTEGDWIAKNVVVNKKRICGPKDLGVSLKQINLLKKLKVKKVLMKEGIPFVPAFLIAFIFTYFLGNVVFLVTGV